MVDTEGETSTIILLNPKAPNYDAKFQGNPKPKCTQNSS
jgi:hypothetical protein